MSTRCNILIRGYKHTFTLYHHHDGYPEGVGADLKRRMAGTSFRADGFANLLVKDQEDEYEIAASLSNDIEYLYTVDLDYNTQRLRCYKVDFKDLLPDGRPDARIICQNKNLIEIPEE